MRSPRLAVVTAAFLALVFLAGSPAARAQSSGGPVVRFSTSFGNIDVQLLPEVAPATVNNFLGYVDRGDYDGSFLHRLVPGFVLQGGGFRYVNDNVETIPSQPAVVNEFNLSNLRGTIAMAKLGSGPDTATNQWFFNLSDNSGNLDNQNGGFTVFGRITNDAGLAVMDAIAAQQVTNAGSPFDQLPVVNYTPGGAISGNNLIRLNSVTRQTSRSVLSVVGTPARGGFVVSRTGGLDAPVTVLYRNGGSAVRGVDYEVFPGTLTLAAGQSEAIIPVRLRPGANRNRKVKVFLDLPGDDSFDIAKFQSKLFLVDLP